MNRFVFCVQTERAIMFGVVRAENVTHARERLLEFLKGTKHENIGRMDLYPIHSQSFQVEVFALDPVSVSSIASIHLEEKMKPKWTVVTNIVSPEDYRWIGTCWEFFDSEATAESCYRRQEQVGNIPTRRPYHPNDEFHLGEAHRR